MSRGATLAPRWLHQPELIRNQPEWRWGFHISRGGIYRENVRFCFRVVGVVHVRKGFLSGDGTYRPRVRRDFNVAPRDNFRHALPLGAPPKLAISRRDRGFHIFLGGTDPGSVFVHRLLELEIYGRVYDQGMVPYYPRVRRDLDVVSRGNSRRAQAP